MAKSELDNFLAYRAPKLLHVDPSGIRRGAAIPLMVRCAEIAAIGALWLLNLPIYLAIPILGVGEYALLELRKRISSGERSGLAELYFQVYGQYGWVQSADVRSAPNPVRPSRNILEPGTYAVLEKFAEATNRLAVRAKSDGQGSLAARASEQADQVLAGMINEDQPGDRTHALDQIVELADLIERKPVAKPSTNSDALDPLSNLVLEARSDTTARQELQMELPQEPDNLSSQPLS